MDEDIEGAFARRVEERRGDMLTEAMENFDIDRLSDVLDAMHEDASELWDLADCIKRYARGDSAAHAELGGMFYGLAREFVGRTVTPDNAEEAVRDEDEGRRLKISPCDW